MYFLQIPDRDSILIRVNPGLVFASRYNLPINVSIVLFKYYALLHAYRIVTLMISLERNQTSQSTCTYYSAQCHESVSTKNFSIVLEHRTRFRHPFSKLAKCHPIPASPKAARRAGSANPFRGTNTIRIALHQFLCS